MRQDVVGPGVHSLGNPVDRVPEVADPGRRVAHDVARVHLAERGLVPDLQARSLLGLKGTERKMTIINILVVVALPRGEAQG